jgi:recombination protein RecT
MAEQKTAVAQRAPQQPATAPNAQLLQTLEPVREYFTRLAGEEKFMKEASFFAQIIGANQMLQGTTPESRMMAFQGLADSGLTLNPTMKLAYLVPRMGKCVLEPSYQGLAKLVTDTGSVKHIEVQCIWEGDEVEVDLASERKILRHVPYVMRGVEKGQVRGFYSVATLADGSKHVEFMSKADVDGIAERSESMKALKAGKIRSTPWTTDYVEMGRKTVLKRHWKHLPKSDRFELLAKAIDLDNSDFDLDQARHRPQVATASVLTDGQALQEKLKDQVRELLKAYDGEDKKAIKLECANEGQLARTNPDFWAGMVKRLGGEPVTA